MNRRRRTALWTSSALAAALGTSLVASPVGHAATAGRVTLAGNHSAAVATSRLLAPIAGNTAQAFQVVLNPRDPAAVAALAKAVSDPASAQFHHYLSAAQWEAEFSPTSAQVASVTSWMRSEGLTVGSVSADRLSIQGTATTSRVEAAFGVRLNTYDVSGKSLQLAAGDVSIPAALAGVVEGVLGLDQDVATTSLTNGSDQATTTAAKTAPQPPPAGFRNPPICSEYYGQKTANSAPAYGHGYASPLPLAACGYKPQQFQSAYGLTSGFASGLTGKGVTVAIVDAYASPTLLSDAQTYYDNVDPAQPLKTTAFSEVVPSSFTNQTLCEASGWFTEQSLDVEAVHATAPGANEVFVGGKSCLDNDLLSAVRTVVDGDLAQVVTNSYGDTAGDLLSSGTYRDAQDTVLEMAATTGITVQFSSGDEGDDYSSTGLTAPDYPASSPWATAVGGTSLAIGSKGSMLFQTGWSTSKSELCSKNYLALGGCTEAEAGTYLPAAPGGYDYGGGGGTSYQYSEPYYQTGVVPSTLADRNIGDTGVANRVVPDISMDADPGTGMLIGLTQTFPTGVAYGQFKEGGTSLASPLLAGVVAVADQAAGVPLGFLNPVIYKADATPGSAGFYDVVPQGKLALFRIDYADEVDTTYGYLRSVRTLDYQGTESYCDGSGSCGTRNVALSTAKGYDSMTGLGTPAPGFVAALSKF